MKSFADYGINVPDHFTGDRKVLCPKCSHLRKKKHDPCLSVNGDKGTWNCHNCGWTGCLKSREEYPLEKREKKIYRRPDPDSVTLDIDPQVLQYFRKRGIDRRTLAKGKVFSTFHYLPGTGKSTLCIAFPYYRNGELLNIKYRDARKNMSQEKDPEPCLWNIDACMDADTVCITEGEIDALTLMEAGFPAAVSVDKGAPNKKDSDASKKLECVTNCLDVLENCKRIILVTDKDESGLRLEKEMIQLLGHARCFTVTYPSDCKDVNDVLVRYGAESICHIIDGADPVPVPGLHRFNEYTSQIDALYNKGIIRGLPTGWKCFDNIFSLMPGSLNIVTGYPSSGKSHFVQSLAVNTVKYLSWKWAIFSPEMMPMDLLGADLTEKIMQKNFFGHGKMSAEEKNRGIQMLNESFFPIYHEDGESSLDSILDAVEVAVVRYGVKAFILDPWNWMDITPAAGQSMTDAIDRLLRKCRQFAVRMNIWFCIVAHPRKPTKDPKTGKLPVATLADISGSEAFFNKADYGLSVYRDPSIKGKENITQVYLLKSKNRYVAQMNTCQEFRYDVKSGTFTDIDPEQEHTYTQDDISPTTEPTVPWGYKD